MFKEMETKYMIGLSGGVNSMAVLCWLIEQQDKPKEIYIFYAHFVEHSPDTFPFVAAGIRYARKHFDSVHVKITRNSILKYFEEKKMIPHPMVSPCSRQLKIEPITQYAFENGITVDLIGYVKPELKRRTRGQQSKLSNELFALQKQYPIGEFSDEWCFEIVKKHIGWYPAIYDITWSEKDYTDGLCGKKDIGAKVFKHNNCLPCKNGNEKDLRAIRKHYPEMYMKAMQLSALLGKFWGRDKQKFYAEFGRELGQPKTCGACSF